MDLLREYGSDTKTEESGKGVQVYFSSCSGGLNPVFKRCQCESSSQIKPDRVENVDSPTHEIGVQTKRESRIFMDGRWLFKDSHIPIVWLEDPSLLFWELLDEIEAYKESKDQDEIDMENLVRHVWEYRRRNAEILDQKLLRYSFWRTITWCSRLQSCRESANC